MLDVATVSEVSWLARVNESVTSFAVLVRKYSLYPVLLAGLASVSYFYVERNSFQVQIRDLKTQLQLRDAEYKDKIDSCRERAVTLQEIIHEDDVHYRHMLEQHTIEINIYKLQIDNMAKHFQYGKDIIR